MDTALLKSIKNDRRITRGTDGAFLLEFQRSLLLALTESGRLTETQYRYAEDKLRQQRYEYEKSHPAHLQK